MMKLMQGYEKDDGATGVDDLDRWPTDSRAVDFLSATTYATEISQLLKVRYPPYILISADSK